MLSHRHTFVQRFFLYTQILLQKGFLHGYFYGGRFLHTSAFKDQDASRKEVLLHGWGWKHDLGEGSNHLGIRFPSVMFLQRGAFTYKCIYTGSGLQHRDGLTQRDDFTKGCFYLQVLLHRDTFNTEMLVHTGALRYKYFCREMVLLREIFRRRRVFTQVPLHRDSFTQMCLHANTSTVHTLLYARILLHRDSFTRTHFSQRHFDTQ